MGKIFEELEKEYGHVVEGFTIEEVIKFSGINDDDDDDDVIYYLGRMEGFSWAVDEEGDSLIVTVYTESYDELIMAECEAENWDTASGYKLSGGWEPVHGLTRQHGYSGAVLHDSENIGSGMVKYMLESKGVFTWAPIAYEVKDELELEGWCLLEKVM